MLRRYESLPCSWQFVEYIDSDYHIVQGKNKATLIEFFWFKISNGTSVNAWPRDCTTRPK